jgi:hypothetical protein
MMKHLFILSVLIAVLIAGCGKTIVPVRVGGMLDYKDPGFGFKIKYPQEWKQLGQTGKAVFARSPEVCNKFLDPRTGEEGGQMTVEVVRYEGKTVNDIIDLSKEDLKQINASIDPPEQVTIGGKPSTKLPYSIQATTKTRIFAQQYFVTGDTAVYVIECKGYGDQWTAHAAVFDTMLKSFEVPIVVAKKSDVWQPSPNLETFTSNFFIMTYPDNLESVPVEKGNKDFVKEMRADRRDCSIHIDVFGAKGLTAEKVWDQNKGNYKSRGTGEATIDGNKAYWVDYSVMANISSRAYFTVKNDKVIRTTINWFAPQKEMYFPVFENMVKSLKLK